MPQTLGDLGDHWRLWFHCLACGHQAGTAFYYLRKRWGDGMRLGDMLPKLRCEQCSAAGRAYECMIMVEPEDYHVRLMKRAPANRYTLRRGHGWQLFTGS